MNKEKNKPRNSRRRRLAKLGLGVILTTLAACTQSPDNERAFLADTPLANAHQHTTDVHADANANAQSTASLREIVTSYNSTQHEHAFKTFAEMSHTPDNTDAHLMFLSERDFAVRVATLSEEQETEFRQELIDLSRDYRVFAHAALQHADELDAKGHNADAATLRQRLAASAKINASDNNPEIIQLAARAVQRYITQQVTANTP